jgi:hypothetical protein
MSSNIVPKACSYGCNTRIYWNASENAYFEVFSGNKHQCPNRQHNNSSYNKKAASSPQTNANKPSYYSTTNNNKKSWSTTITPKPKMSNSLELMQGPIADIQRKYEILNDIVSEVNGKVHGSQSHIVTTANNSISLIVYYEVPEGKREEVKRKFANSIVTILSK